MFRFGTPFLRTAQHGLDSREQFFGSKGCRQIVVGAGVSIPCDAIRLVGARA